MSQLNGKPNLRGAIPLGGRQYQVMLNTAMDARLKLLAQANNCSSHDAATNLLSAAIDMAWNQLVFADFLGKVCLAWWHTITLTSSR